MAKKKLLRWPTYCLILPAICWGNEAGLNELMKSQEAVVKEHMEQAMNFIKETKANINQHENEVARIINSATSNMSCKAAADYPLFNDLNLTSRPPEAQKRSSKSATLYVFVSLNMAPIALERLVKDAKKTNAALVLRGLKNGSYKETAMFLKDIIARAGNGFFIEPELFKRYNITMVPQFVLVDSSENKYDKVTGNVNIQYVLEHIAKEGDLSADATELLKGFT